MKEDYQKALKKSTLFFLRNPVPFNGHVFQYRQFSLENLLRDIFEPGYMLIFKMNLGINMLIGFMLIKKESI